MKKLLIAGGMLLAIVGGAAAAELATQSTVTATITVPYTVGDQTGQVVVSKEVPVPTVTETVTNTVTVTAPTTTPEPSSPAAPKNLRVLSASQTSVSIAWDAVSGATNYHIYRDGNQIGQGPGSAGGYSDSWADNGLKCGTSYTYMVDAQNAQGTGPKATITAATLPCDPPPPTTTTPPPTTTTPPPPPPSGSTLTSSQCTSQAAVNGAVIDNVTVTGNCRVTGDNVTIKNSTIQGVVTFAASSNGSSLRNSKAKGFEIDSADHTTIDGNTLDGQNTKEQNFIWADPAPDIVDGYTITNNSFTNYTSPGSTHSEALFIGGYARNGLVQGNTFYNNGNTGHIFVSWCAPNDCSGTGNNPDARDPKNLCIKGNTFKETWDAYYVIVIRQEWQANGGAANRHGIYTDDNIHFDPNQSYVPRATKSSILVQLYDHDPVTGNSWAADGC